jgi:hypothetical protein
MCVEWEEGLPPTWKTISCERQVQHGHMAENTALQRGCSGCVFLSKLLNISGSQFSILEKRKTGLI